MAEIQIVAVDERDSAWEKHHPRFRVYLQGYGEQSNCGRWTATYDITGADVLQVIDWAQRQAGDSLTYAVALVYDDKWEEDLNTGGGRGLVWLVGMDGNDSPWGEHEDDLRRRMLLRRKDPVNVPVADRMPPGTPDPYNVGAKTR